MTWNDADPSIEDQYMEDVPAEVATPIAWTDGQLIRLEREWRQAQRAYAYHPHVGITALQGDPPTEYQVDYKVNTLVMDDDGNLQYAQTLSVHVWMPPGFPNQPPLVRPMASVFHPNIAYEGVYFSTPWQSSDTLVNFLRNVGEYLAYRAYDPDAVVNESAFAWLQENSGMLPLDARADFAATAGGEPLGRIGRHGAATLDRIRMAIDEMRQSLVTEARAPSASDVTTFANHTRAALSVFLEGDIPDELRQAAGEFDDWTRELPASVPSWEYLRRQRTAVNAAHHAIAVLHDTRPLLISEMEAIERILPAPLSGNPREAVHQIPSARAMQERQLKLPALVRNAEERAETLRLRVEALSASPPPADGVRPDSSLGRRLNAQLEELAQSALAAQQAAAAVLSEFRPVLGRARAEAQALEQVTGWRAYMDTFAQGLSMERQLKESGAAGIQAYFLESEAGRFGPFQYEEPLELGATRVLVRNLLQESIEVFDADTLTSLGRKEKGKIAIRLKGSEPDETYEQTFELTQRCDDALVRLDFVIGQTSDSLRTLQSSDGSPAQSRSWCGQLVALLNAPSTHRAIHEEYRRAGRRWKRLVADLTALSRYKERLATYYLVNLAAETAPRLLAALEAAQNHLKESSRRSAAIASKCSRDVETDQLIIPPRLAKPYADEMNFRKKTQKEIEKIQRLLKTVGDWVRERVGSQRLAGRPELPVLHELSALPENLAAMETVMSDDWLKSAVASLESMLKVDLPLKLQPAPVKHAIARPSAPAAAGIPVAEAVQLTRAEMAAIPVAAPIATSVPLPSANDQPVALTAPKSADTRSDSDEAAEQRADDLFIDDIADTDSDANLHASGEDDLIFEDEAPPPA